MSLIGRRPIKIEEGVKIAIQPREVQISGPKGILVVAKRAEIEVVEDGGFLKCSVKGEVSRELKAQHGLVRSLLNNAIIGVSHGFEKHLEIVGMGYRVAKEGEKLKFSLGFSHPIFIEAPEGIVLEAPDPNKVVVKGIDRHLVGQIAAKIRDFRKPEPYKGKGIRYENEVIRRKAGKAGKAAATA